jgi:UDP-GlcNAc:undecaprenyl-phosphate GlcNAc-1-phosphate transferase
MAFLLIFAVAFLVSLALTPLARRLSLRWGMVAEPGGRRQHQGHVPKLGGLPLLGALMVAVPLVYVFLPPEPTTDGKLLRGVVLGTLVVFAGGVIDDWRELGPGTLFLIQFAGAVVAMGHSIFIEVFTNPFATDWLWTWGPWPWLFDIDADLVWMVRPLALLFTLFWMLGMINAVNMLDGLDGLATGVGAIAAALFAWHSYSIDQYAVAAFPLALAGALLGFLPFNFAPARIFLGSAGAYLLGYQLAALSIISPAKLSTALLVMAIPILDVAWQIITRLRRGQNPLRGDRGHLHFRLSDGGLPTRWIVIGYYVVATGFGSVAVIFRTYGLIKLILLPVLGTAVFALLVWLSSRSEKLSKGKEAR